MLKHLVAIVLPFLFGGLSGCAPAGIPSGADRHWGLKSDFYWTWTRNSEHGCSAWMAKDSWATVQLVVESACQGRRDLGYLEGRGVSYSSVSDHLVFQDYWPWTQHEYSNLIVYDSEGMTSEIRPCPHTLLPEQISALRVVAQEALAEATTDAERRVLARVDERLAATDGAALASGQAGCTDLPPDWYGASSQREEQDPWTLE